LVGRALRDFPQFDGVVILFFISLVKNFSV